MPVTAPDAVGVNAMPSSIAWPSLTAAFAGTPPASSEDNAVAPASVWNDHVCVPSDASSVDMTPVSVTVIVLDAGNAASGVNVRVLASADSWAEPAIAVDP